MQYEKRKIPGVSYAFTKNGIELPVLDISNPLFLSSIDRENLEELRKEVDKKGDRGAERLNSMPGFLKKILSKQSFIIAGLLSINKETSFLSGISTMIMKLGPGLLGKGRKKFLDRIASKSLSSVVLRVRILDLCLLEAEALVPRLIGSPGKPLCFINIAGGTASDSINTLITIRKNNPGLLKDRKIEINVLDMDEFGPAFATSSIESLKSPAGHFHGLDISFRYIKYNWNDPSKMSGLVAERKEWIIFCSSEGGLFEYGSDEVIIGNLNFLYDNTDHEMKIAGTLIKDSGSVDGGMLTILEKTSITVRLLGIDGLNNILKKTRWATDTIIDENPRYVIFTLKKLQ